jgi:hypothetical protein
MPSRNRKPAIHGLATSPGILERKTAPTNAPIAPGSAILKTKRRSTFFNLMCEIADAMVVTTSAVCTEADAIAGAMPLNMTNDVDVTPYPIPNAPSIS